MAGPHKTYTFTQDIGRFIAHAKENGRLVAIGTIQTINLEVVAAWPVKSGYSRGSWFAKIGDMPDGRGAVGRDPIGHMNLVAADLQVGQTYYAGNVAAYARRLELGFVGMDSLGRQYNQQGRYIVRTAMGRAEAIAEAEARRVEAGNMGGPRPGGGGTLPDIGFV